MRVEVSVPTEAKLMMARYYEAPLGRFLSVDPSRRSASPINSQSWNRYTYARNNPVEFTDPNGEEAKVFINNQTTGQNRASFNEANVVKGVQEKFDHAGANATVRSGKPTLGDKLKAAFTKDTIHTVTLVDKPAATESAEYQTAYGHGSGTDNGTRVPAHTHVGNLPQDNPSTSTNERDVAAANNVAHEVGHDLLGPGHTSADKPVDVMTQGKSESQMTTPQEFSASDAKKLQEKTK